MVISKEVIQTRLKKLELCIQKLRPLGKMSKKEFLANSVAQDIADQNLQVAAECLLDIGGHIIAEQGFPLPQDNEDVLRILKHNNIISERLADDLKGLGGFRNILVHDYLGIDYKKVHDYLSSKLVLFEKFASEVVSYVENYDK